MVKSAQEKRTEMFASVEGTRKTTVERFFALLLPILLDVYLASVGVQVRSKTFQSMLKIVQFCSKEYLPTILTVSWAILECICGTDVVAAFRLSPWPVS